MTKSSLNQNGKYVQELINTVETNFVFNNKPINRFQFTEIKKNQIFQEKSTLLNNLKNQINSIEDCN